MEAGRYGEGSIPMETWATFYDVYFYDVLYVLLRHFVIRSSNIFCHFDVDLY